jgi:hypothetical protein
MRSQEKTYYLVQIEHVDDVCQELVFVLLMHEDLWSQAQNKLPPDVRILMIRELLI